MIKMFWRHVEEISPSEKLELLRWMTGLFCLPPGGFSSLSQHFHIRKDSGCADRLPTVSTCTFALYLPEYETFDQLSHKLKQACIESTFGKA